MDKIPTRVNEARQNTSIQIDEQGKAMLMSSREIAELCNKQHSHVIRDIKHMLDELKLDASKFGSIYLDTSNRQKTEFQLPKDLTITLISGYRVDLRYKIVKRMEQLEAEKQSGGFVAPKTMVEALRLNLRQAEENEILKIEAKAMKVDVDAHHRIAKADGSLTFRDSAKALQMRPIDLINFFSQNGWTYRQAQRGPWVAYQPKITSGLLEHKVTTIDRSDGTEKMTTQCRVTPKGLTKLAKLIPVAVMEAA